MAYNNVFPVNYQPYYPQTYNNLPSQQNAQNSQNTGIIWVQGEAGAKSYLVAPNTTVQLWDSESPVIYLKSADASGMPSMKIIDYTIRNQANTAVSVPDNTYITLDQLNAVKSEISALRDELDAIKTPKSKKGAKADE